MTYPNFPTLTGFFSKAPDSSQFTVTLEDPALRTEIEGGYVITRPRHMRVPRKTFACAYRSITESDRLLLEAHWTAVRGGSMIFNWTNPEDLATYAVRFGGSSGGGGGGGSTGMIFAYTGVGIAKLWDVSFILQQA